MKIKLILILLVLILFCGCNNTKENIILVTNIHLNETSLPYFNLPLLDQKIFSIITDNDVNKINFYNIKNNIISVSFETNNTNFTINYNLVKDEFITLDNILSSTDIKNIHTIINNKNSNLSIKDILDCNYIFTDDSIIFFLKNTYTIPFDKFNKDFNISTSTFSVNNNIDLNKKSIALTFDDGPSKYTEEIVNIFKKYNGRGTFFIVGNKINNYQDLLTKLINSGHEIGNHTETHSWLTGSNNQINNEIVNCQNSIKESLNITPKIFRPTYGSINDNIRTIAKNNNLEVLMWDVDSNDWKYTNPEVIANNVIKKVENLDIVLMHDLKESSKDAVDLILLNLSKKDYQFVTVSEILLIKKYYDK